MNKFVLVPILLIVFIFCTSCETSTESKNKQPVISSLTADPDIVEVEGTSNLVCVATDPDGDNLIYTWGTTAGSISGTGSNVSWTAPSSAGTFIVSCKVEDGNGGQDDEIVNIVVGDEPEEEVIRISGKLNPNPSSINRVGLFHSHRREAIKTDNSAPFAITTVSGLEWLLSIPDITKDNAFDNLEFEAISGGNLIFGFFIIGWSDIDGDGKFDPISGEPSGFGHINSDTIEIAMLFYLDDDSNLPIDNWYVGSEKLKDDTGNWFIVDDSQAEPITSWIYRDSTYILVSGLAERRRSFEGDPVDGITVWFTDEDITCIDSPINSLPSGAWLNVRFPEITTRSYGKLEVMGYMRARSEIGQSNIDGNLCRAGLTFVDTLVEKRVRGWLAFESLGGFEEGEITGLAYGSFDVPFCSAVLDTAYIPKEPLSTWQFRNSEYSVVSILAQPRDGYEGIEVIFTDQNITCEDSPIQYLPTSSMKVVFPSITSQIYDGEDLFGFFEVPQSGGGGPLQGKAAITFADTAGVNRVRGWLAINKLDDPVVKAFGTFDVSFCPQSQ